MMRRAVVERDEASYNAKKTEAEYVVIRSTQIKNGWVEMSRALSEYHKKCMHVTVR